MNKDQIKGRVKEVTGNMKKNLGRAGGDADLEAEGAVEEVSGKIQKKFGDAKRNISKKIDNA